MKMRPRVRLVSPEVEYRGRPSSLLNTFFFVLLMLAACVLALKKPTNSVDYWMYVAVIGGDASKHIAPAVISDRLPFYSVKPLFTATCKFVSSVVGPEQAVNLVAVTFYFCAGVVFWLWSGRRTILSILFLCSFVVLDAARNGTPDTMQAFLLLLGAALLQSSAWYWVPLLLAVWVRADAAILATLLIALRAYEKKVTPWAVAPIIASAVWLELGYKRLLAFTTHGSYVAGLKTTAFNSAITLLFPYVLLGWFAWQRGDRKLITISALTYLLHLVIFPNPEPRYALAPLLIVGVQTLMVTPRVPDSDSTTG